MCIDTNWSLLILSSTFATKLPKQNPIILRLIEINQNFNCFFFFFFFFSSVVNVSNVRFVVFETRFRWKNRPSPPPPKAFQPTRLRSDLKSNSLNIPDPLCPSILCSWGLVKRLKWSWPLQISSGIFFSFFIQLSSHPASFFLKNAYSYPIFLKMIFQKRRKKKNFRRFVYL